MSGEIDGPEMGDHVGDINHVMLNTYDSNCSVANAGPKWVSHSGKVQQVCASYNKYIYKNASGAANLADGKYHTITLTRTLDQVDLPAVCKGVATSGNQLFLQDDTAVCQPYDGMPVHKDKSTGNYAIYHGGKNAVVMTIDGKQSVVSSDDITALPLRLYLAAWLPQWSHPSGSVPFSEATLTIASVKFVPQANFTVTPGYQRQTDSYPFDGLNNPDNNQPVDQGI